MLVMHLMRLTDGSEIDIIRTLKPIKALMNKHIVNKEIAGTVDHYANTHEKTPVEPGQGSGEDKYKRGHGKNEEEDIVFFKKTLLRAVVIFMKIPSQSMHYIFVRKPGHKLHKEESRDYYSDINQSHYDTLIRFTKLGISDTYL